MIANDFPPIGGAGVQRSVYFVKYLPEYGWQPTVLTVKDVAFPAKDPTLLDELPDGVRIVRTETLELRRLLFLAQRFRGGGLAGNEKRSRCASDSSTVGRQSRELGRLLRRWLFVPDDRLLWAPFAVAASLRLVRRNSIDALYATLPAYSSGVIGHVVARLTGLPLVLDLRDPWTHDPYFPAPTRLHAWLNSLLETGALREAARIVVISSEMRRRLAAAHPDFGDEKIQVITNGYDAGSFSGVEPVQHDGRFVVTYVGSLYAHHLEALRAVCAAWDRSAQTNRRFAEQAALEVIGRCDPEIRDELAAWPRVPVRLLGYLPHRQAAAHLKGSSVLLLLIKDLDPERDLITIPGKLFEYVGAGAPILMIGPEGDAADIVREAGGRVLRQGALEETSVALQELFHDHASTGDPGASSNVLGRSYDRKALTSELAGLLDDVTTRR